MIAEVRLWGRTIGAVSMDAGRDHAAFQYTPEFAASGIEVSPGCTHNRAAAGGCRLWNRDTPT